MREPVTYHSEFAPRLIKDGFFLVHSIMNLLIQHYAGQNERSTAERNDEANHTMKRIIFTRKRKDDKIGK